MAIRRARSTRGGRFSRGSVALRTVIDTRGLSEREAEALLGATRGSVNRWIHGERRPELSSALAIESVLGISVSLWTEAAA